VAPDLNRGVPPCFKQFPRRRGTESGGFWATDSVGICGEIEQPRRSEAGDEQQPRPDPPDFLSPDGPAKLGTVPKSDWDGALSDTVQPPMPHTALA
jgi:hypothetical protein